MNDLTERLNEWLNDWMSNWMTDWLTEWRNEWMNEWTNDCVNERMNEGMNESRKQWNNEGRNECGSLKCKSSSGYSPVHYLWKQRPYFGDPRSHITRKNTGSVPESVFFSPVNSHLPDLLLPGATGSCSLCCWHDDDMMMMMTWWWWRHDGGTMTRLPVDIRP